MSTGTLDRPSTETPVWEPLDLSGVDADSPLRDFAGIGRLRADAVQPGHLLVLWPKTDRRPCERLVESVHRRPGGQVGIVLAGRPVAWVDQTRTLLGLLHPSETEDGQIALF